MTGSQGGEGSVRFDSTIFIEHLGRLCDGLFL